MKKLIILLVLLVIVVSGCATQIQKTDSSTNTKTSPTIKTTKYADPSGRFSLFIPDEWLKQNISIFDASFGFLDEGKRKLTILGVNVHTNDEKITTDHALVGTKAALESDGPFSSSSTGETTLNNGSLQAKFMEFSTTFSGIKVKGKIVIAATPNSVGSIMFLTNSEDYDKNLEAAEIGLKSFSIK